MPFIGNLVLFEVYSVYLSVSFSVIKKYLTFCITNCINCSSAFNGIRSTTYYQLAQILCVMYSGTLGETILKDHALLQ